MTSIDYSSVTELPGSPATSAQIARLAQRYRFAAEHARGRRVLEVACGAGLGLGWLREEARVVVGGDYTARLLRVARTHYGNRVPLVGLDAGALPFPDGSFDAVILFEAVYYLNDVDRFLREAKRVLSPHGSLLVSSVNPDCGGLPGSSFSTRYLGVEELHAAVTRAGLTSVECLGAFPTDKTSPAGRVVERIRRFASGLNLIPKTLGARVLLKRLFYGRMRGLPAELEAAHATGVPVPVPIPCSRPDDTHRIIYLVARAG